AVTPLTLTSDNNHLQLLVDGATSGEIILTETTYNSYSELVTEIQSKIDSDDNIGNRGVTVEWVAEASGGYLKLTSSGYGSSSRVQIAAGIENAAYADLGMSAGTSTSGTDVAGTINGEEAEGSGLILSGKEGNENTEGLKLKVNLTESQLVTGAEGTITLAKGAGSRLYELINSLTRAGDGTFDCRIRGYQNQVQTLAERVEDIDERLEIRRTTLLEQFYEMELVLGRLSAEQQYLTTQLAALNANWTLGRSKSN
ncbi:MAG: flagellar filament capping protein FliD, partial [candidate division Zixibacteria bacterium]|nr:flagellar filament capping protein FliD [candidate division Zixibacteria bacterium]